METTNFTIDLVSNGSTNIFHDNTLSKFQNQVDPPLDLEGEWEVSLTEIYFPMKFEYDLPEEIEVKFNLEYMVCYEFPGMRTAFKSKLLRLNEAETTVTIYPKDTINEILEKINIAIKNNIGTEEAIEHYPRFTCKDGKTTFHACVKSEKQEKGYRPGIYLKEPNGHIINKYKNSYNIDLKKFFIRDVSNLNPNKIQMDCYIDGKLIEEIKFEPFETSMFYFPEYRRNFYKLIAPRFQDDTILKYLGFKYSVEDFIHSFDSSNQELEVTTPLYHKNNVNL